MLSVFLSFLMLKSQWAVSSWAASEPVHISMIGNVWVWYWHVALCVSVFCFAFVCFHFLFFCFFYCSLPQYIKPEGIDFRKPWDTKLTSTKQNQEKGFNILNVDLQSREMCFLVAFHQIKATNQQQNQRKCYDERSRAQPVHFSPQGLDESPRESTCHSRRRLLTWKQISNHRNSRS